uniref:Uncharacterized protein n=1 Tax=Hymenopteran tombus-related virus TaxID=2822555 RepID=A0A8A6RH68_9TOMB|nr:hypothetical protein [Hymenopteran tombus-related virus]
MGDHIETANDIGPVTISFLDDKPYYVQANKTWAQDVSLSWNILSDHLQSRRAEFGFMLGTNNTTGIFVPGMIGDGWNALSQTVKGLTPLEHSITNIASSTSSDVYHDIMFSFVADVPVGHNFRYDFTLASTDYYFRNSILLIVSLLLATYTPLKMAPIEPELILATSFYKKLSDEGSSDHLEDSYECIVWSPQ